MINVNVKDQASESSSVKVYGIAKVSIAAINPTAAEIKELTGIEKEEEPQYYNAQAPIWENGEETSNTKKRLSIVFYLKVSLSENSVVGYEGKPRDIFVQHRIAVSDQLVKPASTGSLLYVNKHGQSAYLNEEKLEAKENTPYFVFDEIARARENERNLYDFLKVWLKVKTTDTNSTLYFKDNTLFDGTAPNNVVQQLRQLLNAKSEITHKKVEKEVNGVKEMKLIPNEFYGLLGVNSKGYHQFHKDFSLSNPTPNGSINEKNPLIKSALDPQYGFSNQALFPADLKLSVYTEPTADSSSTESNEFDTQWG